MHSLHAQRSLSSGRCTSLCHQIETSKRNLAYFRRVCNIPALYKSRTEQFPLTPLGVLTLSGLVKLQISGWGVDVAENEDEEMAKLKSYSIALLKSRSWPPKEYDDMVVELDEGTIDKLRAPLIDDDEEAAAEGLGRRTSDQLCILNEGTKF